VEDEAYTAPPLHSYISEASSASNASSPRPPPSHCTPSEWEFDALLKQVLELCKYEEITKQLFRSGGLANSLTKHHSIKQNPQNEDKKQVHQQTSEFSQTETEIHENHK
jgi:hypothetical protein